MPYETHWHKRLSEVIGEQLTARTFAAFNVCIDAIVNFTPSDFERLKGIVGEVTLLDEVKPQLVETPEQFLSVLLSALRLGKSLQCIVSDQLTPWFEKNFTSRREEIGGQAGIIANLMASLGAESILYTPMLSSKQATLVKENVKYPVLEDGALKLEHVHTAASDEDPTKVNWIFEYAKGDTYNLFGETTVVPRANRVIFATRPKGLTMAFNKEYEAVLTEMGSFVDVGFMAGYHNVASEMPDGRSAEDYIEAERQNLSSMITGNPKAKFHLEYVTPKSVEFELPMLRAMTSVIKSFGINENEIKLVLDRLGRTAELEGVKKCESAVSLYLAGKALLDALDLERIHIHNLGYYVMVCKNTPETSETLKSAQVEGCLYATAAVSVKAMHGGFATPESLKEVLKLSLSEIGFKQQELFAKEFGLSEDFLERGIADMGDHYVIVTPAFIVDKPVSTVGMGDTISSCSFAYEVSKQKA